MNIKGGGGGGGGGVGKHKEDTIMNYLSNIFKDYILKIKY